MSELLKNNQETITGPRGPIFYLVENKESRVALAHHLAENISDPVMTVISSPFGQDHSEVLLHDMCIKFAKNGDKETDVEDSEIKLNRYAHASSIIRKGGALIRLDGSENPQLFESLVMELDVLFPQDFDTKK